MLIVLELLALRLLTQVLLFDKFPLRFQDQTVPVLSSIIIISSSPWLASPLPTLGFSCDLLFLHSPRHQTASQRAEWNLQKCFVLPIGLLFWSDSARLTAEPASSSPHPASLLSHFPCSHGDFSGSPLEVFELSLLSIQPLSASGFQVHMYGDSLCHLLS